MKCFCTWKKEVPILVMVTPKAKAQYAWKVILTPPTPVLTREKKRMHEELMSMHAKWGGVVVVAAVVVVVVVVVVVAAVVVVVVVLVVVVAVVGSIWQDNSATHMS